MKEAVDDGPGAADVGPEGALRGELLSVRRRGEIVRREGGQVARSADLREGVLEGGAALRVAVVASARVESRVDRGGRFLSGPFREHEDDPVVLRQVELLQLGACSSGELRARGQEE